MSSDRQTGCYVDQRYITSAENAPITNYYLWLPYLMSFLFLLTKLPHSIWKKYFENNLMRQILAGREESLNLSKKANKGGGGGDGNEKEGKKNDQQQNQQPKEGKKKDQQQNQQKTLAVGKPSEVAAQFLQYRSRYTMYQINFAICETANLVLVLASIQVTHWLLNNKFWSYGLEVISYLHHYQGDHLTGQRLHDPMCEVFPTEVQCTLRYGGNGGFDNVQNILCILGNNLFNQKYFFLLWVWWMFVLLISVIGLVLRIFRIINPFFSKCLFLRKYHGNQLYGVRTSSADSFILETISDNLAKVPKAQSDIMEEIAARLKEAQRRPWMDETVNDTFKCEKIPMIKSNDEQHHYFNNIHQSVEKGIFFGKTTEEWRMNYQNATCDKVQVQSVLPLTAQDSLKKDTEVQENYVDKGNSKKKKNKKQNKGLMTESMCPLVPVADEEGESLHYIQPSQLMFGQNQPSINQEENAPALRRPKSDKSTTVAVVEEDTPVASFPTSNFIEWL